MKEKYINLILKIAKSNLLFKDKILENLFNRYYKYCKETNVSSMFDEFYAMFDASYILESTPLIHEVSDDLVKAAIIHLKEVQNNLANIPDGISLEEAQVLLDWDVQNARTILSKSTPNFKDSSLNGVCGYAQVLTIIPFQNLGVKITVNNASIFPLERSRHAFGTVTLPIKEGNDCYQKDYLLDITYRQFFSTILSVYGRYYVSDEETPSAGYFVCKTPEGRTFATELLKKGYIELNPHNAYYYGMGFEMEGIPLTKLEKYLIVKERTGEDYINIIKNNIEELDITEEEKEEYNKTLNFPGDYFAR